MDIKIEDSKNYEEVSEELLEEVKMKKAYVVWKEEKNLLFSKENIKVFLKKEEAESYVKISNLDYDTRKARIKVCEICNEDKNLFKLSNDCKNANIIEDRYGKYCENNLNNLFVNPMPTHYGFDEIELCD